MKPIMFASGMLSIVLLSALAVGFISMRIADASAPSGLPASQSMATTTSVGPQARTRVFTSNGSCAARVVTTGAQAIRFIIGDPLNGDLASTTFSANAGHWQAASTTEVYDGGLYGCGDWYMLGQNASTTITVSELR